MAQAIIPISSNQYTVVSRIQPATYNGQLGKIEPNSEID